MHPCLDVSAQMHGEPKFDKSASNGAICRLVRSCSYGVRQVDKEHRPTGLHDFLLSMTEPSLMRLSEFPALFFGKLSFKVQTNMQSGVSGICYQFILSTTRKILYDIPPPELIVEIPMFTED